MDAMLLIKLMDLLLYDRMCDRREERAESQKKVRDSVCWFFHGCGAFGCLCLPWIN